jgi:hypothetical protein
MKVHSTRHHPNNSTIFYDSMDVVLSLRTTNRKQTIRAEDLKKAFTICIVPSRGACFVKYFIENVLPHITQPINLIICNSDQTFPNNTDARTKRSVPRYPQDLNVLLNHQFINKIFVENLDCNLPKTFTIPVGINAKSSPSDFEYFLKYENLDINKPLKFTNFNVERDDSIQWAERRYVRHLCDSYWKENNLVKDVVPKELSHAMYLKALSKYMFTICVHGGGIDVNPKLWEALLVGTIPIIRENKPHTDIYIDLDFPVAIVKDWSLNTFRKNKLEDLRDRYYHHFTDPKKRQDMLRKLSADYWINYVNQK